VSVIQATETKAIEQERYHEDKSIQIIILALFFIALTVGILGLIILLRDSAVPPPTYFTAMPNGALFPEKPLDQPSLETNELLNWITEAMMESNTFNFIDYNAVMDASSAYFTKEGYESYKNALAATKIIETVVEKKYVLRAVARDAPQLLLEKPFAGRYMWKIKIPMQFKYQNVRTDYGTLVEVTLIVMRVPTAQSPNGVLILKYDLEQKGRG
jgi:intracellular multiplication protein IcmL